MRAAFVLGYLLVAGWEYRFGGGVGTYGGWYFFHLVKLMVYLAGTCAVFYALRRFATLNARVVVLVMDIILLPLVYLFLEP